MKLAYVWPVRRPHWWRCCSVDGAIAGIGIGGDGDGEDVS